MHIHAKIFNCIKWLVNDRLHDDHNFWMEQAILHVLLVFRIAAVKGSAKLSIPGPLLLQTRPSLNRSAYTTRVSCTCWQAYEKRKRTKPNFFLFVWNCCTMTMHRGTLPTAYVIFSFSFSFNDHARCVAWAHLMMNISSPKQRSIPKGLMTNACKVQVLIGEAHQGDCPQSTSVVWRSVGWLVWKSEQMGWLV